MSRRRPSSSGPARVRSWKSIQQNVARPPAARRRGKGKTFIVWAGAVCFSVALIFLSYLLLFEPERILGSGPEFTIEQISFETDGSLSKDWLLDRLDLVEGASLLQTDIFRLREQIESHPQVQSCVVRRKFPETLQVRIVEHRPVLRLRVQGEGNTAETVFVARDGTIFPGIGREAREVRRMPFVTGTSLVETPRGYAPVPGFRRVADLVELAQTSFPDLFGSWRIVDLSLYDADPAASFSAIRVRATNVSEILFGTDEFSEQLLRLQDIITLTRDQGYDKLSRVDLRFDESVPVFDSWGGNRGS
ncbi:MAG: FtsQ-type POTRA domain-containing protein [Verrucomicrobiota bacterium]